jgi:hypothetical protein
MIPFVTPSEISSTRSGEHLARIRERVKKQRFTQIRRIDFITFMMSPVFSEYFLTLD